MPNHKGTHRTEIVEQLSTRDSLEIALILIDASQATELVVYVCWRDKLRISKGQIVFMARAILKKHHMPDN